MSQANDFSDWIGRRVDRVDLVSERLCDSFEAIFQSHIAPHSIDEAPFGIHWCLAPAIVGQSALGEDGHPQRGDFLPPIPLPRRMWAGVETSFFRPLQRGEKVTRTSQIADIGYKKGRSGDLCFVTVDETYITVDGPAVVERVSLVYRQASVRGEDRPATANDTGTVPFATRHWENGVDPILLFRYSALTFNSHRIHYDRNYTSEKEGYSDLLVHGPLQATLLLNLFAEGRMPRHFNCRAVRPLFSEQPFHIEGTESVVDEKKAIIRNMHGEVTMQAVMQW